MKFKKVSHFLASCMLCSALIFTGTSAISAAQTSNVNTAVSTAIDAGTKGVSYHTVHVTKSAIRSQGTYTAIQAALDEAREHATDAVPYKIIVEAGSYELGARQALHIYGNTYLCMKGVTLTQESNAGTNMLKMGDSEDTAAGYYYKNVTVEGGVWNANGNSNTTIKIGHAKNFTMKDAVVKNVKNAHLMEAAGIDGMKILDCTFQDQILDKDCETLFYEAIQIDVLLEEHIVGFRAEDLIMQNILIDHCTFSNVPRGVGSHTAILNSPADHISITNNTFTNAVSAAVQGMNWINCDISGNTITGTPRGIALYGVREEGTFLPSTAVKEGGVKSSTPDTYQKPAENQNLKITNNTISCSGNDPYAEYEDTAILLGGVTFQKPYKGEDGDKLPAGSYYLSGAEISGNTITTIGHGIRLQETRNSSISNNNITYNGTKAGKISYYGVQLRENSTSNSITKNTITKPHSNGIYLFSDSSATDISENTILTPGKYGIDIENGTAETISKNKINTPNIGGIYVFNKASVENMVSNHIEKPKTIGINVDNASVTTVKSNSITSPKENGIYLHNKAACGSISSNNIKSAGAAGINIDTNSSVTAIKSNSIASPKENGIYLHNKAACDSILSNNMKSAGAAGINIDTNSSVNKTIGKNTISSAATNAIYLHNKANVKKMDGNIINSAKKHAIFAENATISTISGNKITAPAVNGIYLYNKAAASAVSRNTITAPGKYGIDTENASVSTVSKNTVKKAGAHSIVVLNKGKIKAISGNKLSSGKGYGIFINSIKSNMSVDKNTVSKCSQNLIHINPSSEAYTITVNDNKLTGTSRVDGIYASSGNVNIRDNTIASTNQAVFIGVGAKAEISPNVYNKNKVNAVTTGSVKYKNIAAVSAKAAKKGKSSVKVSWKKSAKATGYIIYRSNKADKGYKQIASVNKKKTISYIDNTVKAKKTYYYKVVPYAVSNNKNVTFYGAESKPVSIKL